MELPSKGVASTWLAMQLATADASTKTNADAKPKTDAMANANGDA